MIKRILDDLKAVEEHFRNVAIIVDGEPEAKVYKEAANSLTQTIKNYKPGNARRSSRSTLDKLSGIVNRLNKKSDDTKVLRAYNYASNILKDVIEDYRQEHAA